MKEYKVKLGGEERLLRYTTKGGIQLFNRFQRPLSRLFMGDCCGLDDAGKPGAETNPEVQVAVLYLGLRQGMNGGLSEDHVAAWVDKHLEDGGAIGELMSVATKAAYYSGIVVGKSVDLDAMIAQAQERSGKDAPEATSEAPSPTSAIRAAE